MAHKDIPQHNPMHQKGGSRPKGNQVGQGIELTSEGALRADGSCDASVEKVEDAGRQDEAQRDFDLGEITLVDIGFDNFGQGDKTANQVAGGKQVREEIDFQLPFRGFRRTAAVVRRCHIVRQPLITGMKVA